MYKYRLDKLSPNQQGIIKSVESNGDMRRRLQDLGFITGGKVVCLYKSPFGDPTAYRVKDSTIALRKEDASTVILKNNTNEEKIWGLQENLLDLI